jgi:hypothetical protein
MWMRPSVATGMLFGLLLANAPAAFAQLTTQQVQGISRCQDSIARETRTFARKAEEAFEGCSIAKLNPVLKAENGLITPERFGTDDTRATATCNRLFSGLATASTRYINAIVRACGPVEALVMAPDPPPAGDPLGLVDTWGLSTISEVAGALCGEALFLAAEVTSFSTVPRGADIASSDPGIPFPNIDPRCDF